MATTKKNKTPILKRNPDHPPEMYMERVNYTISENGMIVGWMVDLPGVIMQAKDMDEFKKHMKVAALSYIQIIEKILNSDTPFNMIYHEELKGL